jgi:predicted aconitase with swiveling domain
MDAVLKGRPIVHGRIKGKALVSTKPLSFLGGIDPETGIVIEKGHDLQGESVSNVVLCFPYGHGSTVGSYVLYSLAKKKKGPKAIINEFADPVVVVGAVIAEVPMVDQIDISQIHTGDTVEVDGETGTVKILEGQRRNVSYQ